MIATRNFSTRSSTAKKEAAAAAAGGGVNAVAAAALAATSTTTAAGGVGNQDSTESSQSVATVIEDCEDHNTVNKLVSRSLPLAFQILPGFEI